MIPKSGYRFSEKIMRKTYFYRLRRYGLTSSAELNL
jgi:hypothetical protein